MSWPVQVEPTDLPGVVIVRTRWFEDARGSFSEVYNQADFLAAGLPSGFIQENHVVNPVAGTVRGMHFQRPPFAQAKLIRVVKGAVLDISIDIRQGSPNYGRCVAVALSSTDRNQLFIPAGFAHGYCTIEPGTEIVYRVDAPYNPEAEAGVSWDDPDLGIVWPIARERVLISERDRLLPRLAEIPAFFTYDKQLCGEEL
jgi:dTDP-4-dehydrorhamnose 3,5-epimerase